MSGSCQEDLLEVREWSKGPPASTGVVVRAFLVSGSGREALPNVRNWS